MPSFIIFYTPTRASFLDDASPKELAIVDRHFEYLKALHTAGRLLIAGRCADGPPGIAVFEAESDNEARAVMDNDPAVRAGVFQGQLRPYRVALLRGA